MQTPKISLIVAISENHVMAKDGKFQWKIPMDYDRYLRKIAGHVIIAGRKTFDTTYKDTVNIVITRDETYVPLLPAVVAHSVSDALEKAKSEELLQQAKFQDEIFIIGGGEIFRQTIDIADKLYLTLIHKQVDGNVFFPDYSQFTKVVYKEDAEDNGYSFTFLDLEKE